MTVETAVVWCVTPCRLVDLLAVFVRNVLCTIFKTEEVILKMEAAL